MAAVLAGVSAFATNPYQYGTGDTSITIPFVKAIIDPRLYPGDYLTLQRPFYYTYLWSGVALAQRLLGCSLPSLFFAIYLVALAATFFALMRIATRLFEGPLCGILASTLLLFSKPTLGGVEAIHSVLSTREVAIPLLLLGLDAILGGRIVRAWVFMGIAYLVHPLTCHFVIVMALASAFVEERRYAGQWRIALPIFAVLASPILVWHFRSSPPHFNWLGADRNWIVALHMRSAHHVFPFTWGWSALAQALAVLLAFFFGWSHRGSLHPRAHRMVLAWVVAIVVLCLAGIAFSEWVPIGIGLLLQPLRSFQFMVYLSTLYLANALECGLAADWSLTRSGWWALGAMVLTLYGMPHWQRALVGLAAVAGTLLVWPRARSRPVAIALSLVTAAVIGGAVCHVRDVRAHERWAFSMTTTQDPSWLDVQLWAREHTSRDATFIIAPRQRDEFRIESERSVYADWEDGGLMNGNPSFGAEWVRRMGMLGLAPSISASGDFCALGTDRVMTIATEVGWPRRRVFIVRPLRCVDGSWPTRYVNARYRVCEVTRN